MNPNENLADLQGRWQPPVELTGSSLRDVRLSVAGRVVAFFAVLMFGGAIGAGIALSRLTARQETERQSLRSAGVEAEAVVTRHWRSGGEDDKRKIAYEFQYQGKTYHGSSNAPRRIWGELSVGSTIAVRFVASNPQLNHPAQWEGDVVPKFVPGMVTALLAGGGLMMVFLIRRQMRLLSDGRPAPGRVTKVTRVKHGHMLRYEFPTLSGGIVKGRGESRKTQPVGATICVIYDRDNPKRNAPYPLNLVRVDR